MEQAKCRSVLCSFLASNALSGDIPIWELDSRQNMHVGTHILFSPKVEWTQMLQTSLHKYHTHACTRTNRTFIAFELFEFAGTV